MGVGLTAGIRRKRKAGENSTGACCKCGSTTHKRTTHRDCPLKKTKLATTTPLLDTLQVDTQQCDDSQNAAGRSYDNSDDERKVFGGYESDRSQGIQRMVSVMCLRGTAEESDDDSNGSCE